MRWLRRLFALILLLALVAGGLALWVHRTLTLPYRSVHAVSSFEVRVGEGASAILRRLEAAGLLADSQLTRLYLVHRLGDPPLKAGEYSFAEALAPTEVLDKLIRGEVVTHAVTLIEGLDLFETAETLANKGFGDLETLRREMRRVDLIADLDSRAENLEGYLFPDTYNFARGTTEAEIVATLVRTFRRHWENEIAPLLGAETEVRDLVTLASIVEKEARLEEERAVIAAVYWNRIERGIGLYADPTVIYAKKLRGDWDGNLRRPDLKLDDPYNTYVYPGLPPGPIASPGLASLLAASSPADVPYLYFVSRNDGSHVFAEDYSEHRRNVNRWQRQYWRERWAEERRQRQQAQKNP